MKKKNKYKIVNPSNQRFQLGCKLEKYFIEGINYFGRIERILELDLPLRAVFPEYKDFDFFQYQLKSDEEVYCYGVDLTVYNKDEYIRFPFSKAVLVHKFKFAQIYHKLTPELKKKFNIKNYGNNRED